MGCYKVKVIHFMQQKKSLGPQTILSAQNLTLAYDNKTISSALDLDIPAGKITVIIGPNGCGKSTLLKGLSRIIKPTLGQVVLDGQAIEKYSARQLAQTLGLLPQSANSPAGITVFDLVARGRYPHQGLLHRWTQEDEQAVNTALQQTQLSELATCYLDELSGGQRQRVWLALVLAQQPHVLMLDEPTTYLDIAHQLEVLELCRQLNRQDNRTLVMILHDLNLAARYADFMIAMRDGKVIATGEPKRIFQAEVIKQVFGIDSQVINDPVTATPMVIPIANPV